MGSRCSAPRTAESHFLAMLNALIECQRQLDLNEVPETARESLGAAIESCREAYRERFGD